MKFKITMLLLVLGSCNSLFAWENKKTHPAITKEAVNNSAAQIDNYLKTQLSIGNGLSAELYWNFPSDIEERMTINDKVEPTKTKTVLDWLKAGSTIEDEDGRWKAPWRPRHHFYDPTRNAGLDNHTAHPEWNGPGTSSWLPLGASALDWAIDGHSSYEPFNNHDKWTTARNLFYDALTAQSQSGREAYLAESLLKLGCVLHLLEDMGVPAHTRNDFLYGHYRSIYKWDWGNDLEEDVEAKIEANGGNSLWSGSSAVAFDKLTKYFDTDTRVSEHYLGDSVLPPDEWGLSEATNYQFWSLSTVSGSYLLKYYFPHPHMAHMGTPITESSATGYKTYFNGANYGVSHMARESYTYYKAKDYEGGGLVEQEIDSTITTDDENVFEDYAEITIPRTIDYATGLANYFFRGRLSMALNYITCEEIELIITNESENSGTNQYLKGGVFELYWDDAAGNRTQINDFVIDGGWTSSSTLAYNGQKTITFIKPSGAIEKFVIVYKGNICENTSELDSDDSDALAVAIIENSGCPFASDDCGCFLNPSTPTWNSSTTYSEENLAEYSGSTYQSNASNNTNHIPSSNPAWWTKVSNTVSSGNSNWNAYPPFGGIGKSPKYIRVSFSGIGEGRLNLPNTPNRSFVLTKAFPYSCQCKCYYSCNTNDMPLYNWRDGQTYSERFYIQATSSYCCAATYLAVDFNIERRPPVWVAGTTYLNQTSSPWHQHHVISAGGEDDWYPWYRCILTHFSSADNEPGIGPNWQTYWQRFDPHGGFCDDSFCGGYVFSGGPSPNGFGCSIFDGITVPQYCSQYSGDDFDDCVGNCCDGNLVSDGKGTATIEILTSLPSYPAWLLGYDYEEGDIVIGSDGKKYVCNVPHTSTINDIPITGGNWQTYWALSGCCGE